MNGYLTYLDLETSQAKFDPAHIQEVNEIERDLFEKSHSAEFAWKSKQEQRKIKEKGGEEKMIEYQAEEFNHLSMRFEDDKKDIFELNIEILTRVMNGKSFEMT